MSGGRVSRSLIGRTRFPFFLPGFRFLFLRDAQPLNNDNNDQDGYYGVLLAVADHHFHGSAQNCDFSQFKSLVGAGVRATGATLWTNAGCEEVKVVPVPAALIHTKLTG